MAPDNRPVVLLKSKHTLNRFYVLAPPNMGWKNAEEIEDFPPEVLLGIAYPCLEDGLNDFAVIRSTFDTIDCFPDDKDLRDDLIIMVVEARETLLRRLRELRDRLKSRQAHFLGTDLREFKDYAITLATKGNIRRTLDSMMKLDVYESVATYEANLSGEDPNTMYHYEFRPENRLEATRNLHAHEFVVRLFDDMIVSAEVDESYDNKYTFDKNVFQKFIGLMFINYATTDPIFYGTDKADYGVSAGRDMGNTPLYRAVGEALREIERQLAEDPNRPEEDVILATRHSDPHFGHSEATAASGDGASGEGVTDDGASVWDTEPSLGASLGIYPEPAAAFEAPPFDLSEPSVEASQEAKSAPEPPQPLPTPPQPTAPPERPTPMASPAPPADGRRVELPGSTVVEQRLMFPLKSITLALQQLQGSSDPMAATCAQMIGLSVDALQAALREWGLIENNQ